MTNKNLTEKSNPDAKYGYGDLTPDEIALLKSDGIDKIDKTGSNVFAVSKSVLKDITRRADQQNNGKTVKPREKKMETAESMINRLRSQASSIMEVSTNPGDVPAPAASDNPQAGANEVQNDPKPGKSDSTSNIKLKLKNIAIAAADVHDGVSEDSEIEPWMEQCITRTESEMKKIVDHFRSKTDDDKNVTNESLEEAKYKMPLPGHIYHEKSIPELQFIRKDASAAAKAMRGHNPQAEAKYLDQVNDASTILHHRAAFGLQQQPRPTKESVDEAKNYYQGANPFTIKTGADGKLVTVSKPKPLKGNAAIRAAMAAYDEKMKKNEETIYEDNEYEMARNQLATAKRAVDTLTGMLHGESDLPAWVQSKITQGSAMLDAVADYMASDNMKEDTDLEEAKTSKPVTFKNNNKVAVAHDGGNWLPASVSYSDGTESSLHKDHDAAKAAAEKWVNEEVELEEKLAADATAADYIHDFVHSKNPRFEGMTKAQRTKMALGAFYSKNEEVELYETKSSYPIYHSTYSDAVNHALDHHENNKLSVSPEDRDTHVGLGPKKPSEGHTVSLHIPANHKETRKKHMIHLQVYNRGGSKPYELNTYSSTSRNLQKEEFDSFEEEVFHVVKSKTDSYGPAGHVSTHATSKRARSAADRRSEKNGGAAFHVVRVEEETSSLARKILEARVKKSLEPKAKPLYSDHEGNATFVYPVKKTTSEDTTMPTNDGQHPDADPAPTTIPNVTKKKKPTGSSPAASAMEEYFQYIGIHESRRNGSVLSTDENKE